MTPKVTIYILLGVYVCMKMVLLLNPSSLFYDIMLPGIWHNVLPTFQEVMWSESYWWLSWLLSRPFLHNIVELWVRDSYWCFLSEANIDETPSLSPKWPLYYFWLIPVTLSNSQAKICFITHDFSRAKFRDNLPGGSSLGSSMRLQSPKV